MVVDTDLLRIENACAGSVVLTPSKFEEYSPGLRVFAARKLQKSEVTGS